MDTHTLSAEKRSVFGRKVKNLRKVGTLPVNIYGKDVKSESLQVTTAEFLKVYAQTGETGLISLSVADKSKKGEEHAVLVANIQKDPVTGAPLHIDFRQVNLKEKISANVPVELTGDSPAVKQGLGTVVQHVNEIEVEALPADLPEKFELDISGLAEVDQALYVKDITVDRAKVEVKAEAEQIVVKVEPLEKIEEPEPVPEAAAEGVEGEAPADAPTEGGQVAPQAGEGESKEDSAPKA